VSDDTDPRFESVLEMIADGVAVRQAIRSQGMSPKYFYAWVDRCDENGKRYARARESCLAAWADDIVGIADTAKGQEQVAEAKLMIDSRKWMLARLMPQKYGERVSVDSTHRIEMTPEQMDARISELQRALALSDAAGTARIARGEGADQESEQDH
jgi:hypothetical protein